MIKYQGELCMVSIKCFKKEYVKAIRNGDAALFAGAGLSRPSGFVVWKELLRPLAADIGINIDEEHDLTAVAQYVKNKQGNRGTINQAILDAFRKDVQINENVKILTRLPIFTYWTTNYDQLIEKALEDNNRKPDVKTESCQLPYTIHDRDVIVYKMHGDCNAVANAVLTKEDYIRYEINYPYFRDILQGDLLSKTFLFVGFSFDDPNFESILNQITLRLNGNIHNHYCFMKRVSMEECDNQEEFGYKKAVQDLREDDLKRHGIQTVYVNDYEEITLILRDIEKQVKSKNVFISGSADFFDEGWAKDEIEKLSYTLSKNLISKEFKITSGFGNVIGSSIINGALDEINSSHFKHYDEHLCLRPFPQNIADESERNGKWKKYREDMLNDNGVAIFLCGNKRDSSGKKTVSEGCIQEFNIAKENNCIIIPIASTGGAAHDIMNKIKSDISNYSYIESYVDVLENEKKIDVIVDQILELLESN